MNAALIAVNAQKNAVRVRVSIKLERRKRDARAQVYACVLGMGGWKLSCGVGDAEELLVEDGRMRLSHDIQELGTLMGGFTEWPK